MTSTATLIWQRNPEAGLFLHFDQGNQYTGQKHQTWLEALGIQLGMAPFVPPVRGLA